MTPRTPPTPSRFLVVTADDFGVGPETSRGILDLAVRGSITSTVLLVNSPFAGDAVTTWRKAGRPIELGWHPCLTLDAPVLSPAEVPSLVGPDGRFRGLGELLKRLLLGRVRVAEIEAELRAQYRRFVDLVGGPPVNVNAHHHVHVFRPVGDALARVLGEAGRPYVRRVAEPARTLWRVPGARLKRAFLTRLGRAAARRQAAAGLPGCPALLGITDPPCVRDPQFFARWLAAARGQSLELTCHPGHFDPTLVGRDGTLADGQIHRRVWEFDLLHRPAFLDAVRAAGFTLVPAAEIAGRAAVAA
ncbi:MAG: Cellobiose phosphotransferase system YdjC-like protein [Gemmataceae bacterium]|nr:Cellobiose phosphotransferase system YdjC-like protein [Gemmataceae bacterium]